jgi:hypothetical protein
MSLLPHPGAEKVLSFFGLQLYPSIYGFLQSHTTQNGGGLYDSIRNSREIPFRWLNYLEQNLDELRNIQDECAEAMNLWGYIPINMTTFKGISSVRVLADPPWKEMIISSGSDDRSS